MTTRSPGRKSQSGRRWRLFEDAFARRDGMAVRVFERFAEEGGERLFHARRDGVFQRLGLGVHLAPVEAEHARQQQFDEPMAADDAPRLGDAALA